MLMKCGIDPGKTDFIHHSCSLSITACKVFQSCLFKGNTKREGGMGGGVGGDSGQCNNYFEEIVLESFL